MKLRAPGLLGCALERRRSVDSGVLRTRLRSRSAIWCGRSSPRTAISRKRCGCRSPNGGYELNCLSQPLNAAPIAPQIDVQPRTEPKAFLLADLDEPASALCQHRRIDAFGHQHHAVLRRSDFFDDRAHFAQIRPAPRSRTSADKDSGRSTASGLPADTAAARAAPPSGLRRDRAAWNWPASG